MDDDNVRVCPDQLFSKVFYIKICKVECNTTSDWLNQSEVV